MKYFKDGDQMCIVSDKFINLQESESVFIDWDSEQANIIKKDGFSGLLVGELRELMNKLGVI